MLNDEWAIRFKDRAGDVASATGESVYHMGEGSLTFDAHMGRGIFEVGNTVGSGIGDVISELA